MKKLLILAGFCLCTSYAHGQFLKTDGSFINPTGILGYCKTDGTVEDKSHNTIGFIKTDGTVQNKAHVIIGYVKTDGTMEDNHHTALGYFKTGGNVEDASHKLIAQVKTQTEATLKIFFFP